jgi:lipoprotein NlpI
MADDTPEFDRERFDELAAIARDDLQALSEDERAELRDQINALDHALGDLTPVLVVYQLTVANTVHELVQEMQAVIEASTLDEDES